MIKLFSCFLQAFGKTVIYCFIILAFLLLCCSCRGDAIEDTQAGDFEVELLFEKDGCRVYRFKDGLRRIYFSDCRGKISDSYTTGHKTQTVIHNETLNN